MLVRQRGAKYELRVKHRLLPKPYYGTFDTEQEARIYGQQLEALLAQGLIPQDLAKRADKSIGQPIPDLIDLYEGTQPVSQQDRDILPRLNAELAAIRETDITYAWAQAWVRKMKIEDNLAPGTIRKKVGTLARLMDWRIKEAAGDGPVAANPLRMLPRGYSAYSDHERAALAARGREPKRDKERDRRFAPSEEQHILASMSGEKRPDRERALYMPDREDMIDLFTLIVNTGLRLREAYRLRAADVKLHLRTIHVARSKTDAKRDVPILPVLYGMLERRVAAAVERGGPNTPIFPWWDGVTTGDKDLARITAKLSRRFGSIFAYAGCEDLKEHDLRHEATCRWMQMTDAEGRWLYRAEEVMKITGHKDARTFMRYLSLRGSDLADRLWTGADGLGQVRAAG